MHRSLDVPDLVRRTARSKGEDGARWLRELPGIVATIERRWRVRVGASLEGGHAAFVAEAVAADGTPLVVKIALPDGDAFDHEVQALSLAHGRGCVALVEYDRELSAALLERLGRTLDSLGLPTERQLEIVCETVRNVWIPVGSTTTLPTGAEKARRLAEFIATSWEILGRPCSRPAVDAALSYAAERAAAFDPANAVLVHGDAHSWNTLESVNGTFRLVDPHGLASEPAHDLGIPMRHFNDELLAGDTLRLGLERAELLSRLTGVDAAAIWAWGFVERMSSGLYCMTLGRDDGAEFLAVADRWAAV